VKEQPAAALLLEDGVCDPLAVKAKPWRAKNATVLSPGSRPGSGPHHPRFLACDGPAPAHCRVASRVHANPEAKEGTAMKADIYQRITDQIVCELEKGVRPWLKPWNAEHAAGRITRPLRGNGIPYKGINVLMLWSAALEKGYAAPV
jgi:N-terminal domain of anti-restriction factor ArdC